MKTLIIVGISLSVLLYFLWSNVVSIISKNSDKMKANIGTEYILDSDTLKVIDYSILNDTYTLSNGAKINRLLIENK
jgi:protein associated with RNAse G/E